MLGAEWDDEGNRAVSHRDGKYWGGRQVEIEGSLQER